MANNLAHKVLHGAVSLGKKLDFLSVASVDFGKMRRGKKPK
jgi:hypothetical protein